MIAALVALSVAVYAAYETFPEFKAAVDSFAAGLRDLFFAVVAAAVDAFNGLKAWFQNMPSDWMGMLLYVGEALLKGLIAGITASFSLVTSVINGLGSLIITTIKNVFDIKSPSGVFEEIGENLGEGLTIGLTNSEDVILQTIINTGNAMKEAMTESLAGGDGMATGLSDMLSAVNNSVNDAFELQTKSAQKIQ